MRGVQVKMARAALGWGVRDLAAKSGVTANTVNRIENGADAKQSTMDALEHALVAAGITFLDGNYSGSGGPGVRLMQPTGASIDVSTDETVQYKEHLTNDAPPGAGG
ncbi:helix-turn-helix transcriptional regulator [Rhizobium sp. 3T7]|uniref:helix-turn-helix domain-containing protein n=1 Tax=Rhizobium sp. 3T7 TaxID=2874922 RepID=UPI001CC9C800|nr:helix-turn-helix transcriptional regulator [Rhizobium sp. 3T7]MBZ9790539.1 helix-turn-helix transcriptional regulator [Rhizobium sp. 3T7]